jgi:NADP-reducing hydrogenase subunit HndB
MATCGIASGARETMDYFIDELDKRKIDAVVTQTGCMGYCYAEPTVEVKLPGQDPVVFGYVDTRKAEEIIEKYILNGELVDGIIPQNYQTINDKNIGRKAMTPKYKMHVWYAEGRVAVPRSVNRLHRTA